MHRLVLVLGGVRSGKSRFAQELAQRLGGDDVLFVATAEAGDGEMNRRIDHHRRSRPGTWKTLEQPLRTGEAIIQWSAPPPVIVVDCMTLLVSNVLLQSDGQPETAQQGVKTETDALIAAARHHAATLIVVSGEVGQGIVPETALGRSFRDLLGWANQQLAAQADATYLMVAGLAVNATLLATPVQQAAASLQPLEPRR